MKKSMASCCYGAHGFDPHPKSESEKSEPELEVIKSEEDLTQENGDGIVDG